MSILDSLPWMESTDAKYARASELMDAFIHESQTFLETVRPIIYPKSGPDSTFLVVTAPDLHPPMRLSTLFGDCVHNARCTLDHIICGLVRVRRPHHACGDT